MRQYANDMSRTDKKLWANALRSGAFEQGRGQLKFIRSGQSPRYCCLGVAAELDLLEEKNPSFCKDNKLPINIQSELANMNDSSEMSFPQIANWIEENL